MGAQKIPFPEAQLRFGRELNELGEYMEQWANGDRNSRFVVYDGDTTIGDLNLDSEEYEFDIIGIVVNGRLKADNIFNFETDYGMNLVVLGDLEANNIAVGGQYIHVKGDLMIKRIFMGSYNHGILFVDGSVSCPIIINDDYHFCVTGEGQVEGTVYGSDCIYFTNSSGDREKCPDENTRLDEVFDSSVISEYGINFSAVSKMIANHQPILRNPF